MDAAQAISLAANWIRSHGVDYPTDGLVADRFEAGWSVYAPVTVDESDPMAFLDMPVGRSVFLVGDSGRIEEVSSSVPPQQAQDRFTTQEIADAHAAGSDEAQFMAEFERAFQQAAAEHPPAASSFTVVDAPSDEARTAAEASRLLEPIAQRLAQLGPPGWERLSAEFAFTVSAEVAQLWFWSGDRSMPAPVPLSIGELVRHQRNVAARMPAGPWWRLLLTVTNHGVMTVEYDYGDQPFPDGQLLAAEHYRNDLAVHPRSHVPVWLAGYVAGPAAQGRDPQRAAAAAAADAAVGRTAVPVDGVPSLAEVWARWAALSAVYVGVRSEWGPRILPGHAWYESDRRSGSVLFVLPGERAVLSGGKWDSPLLEAAYNGGRPLPDLYSGAPAWVTDSVLNTRNRNGLLTFCLWWTDGRWHRGATDTSGELDVPLPPIRTPGETVRAMTSLTGPGTDPACAALLTAIGDRKASAHHVAALFARVPGADVGAAVNQLSLAGLLTA
ncbi:hypothetical protein [Micromonospora sp. 15K316]|uniref:hypothetical protein n=1 Tax=Micromonospora sp. 15K316 TaxID=2530376 RepID=UPI001A9E6686|nr:hypothetical protein [Micromonospora sp. 15K316]